MDAIVNDPNDVRMSFSRDGNVMAVIMRSNGVQFYDISDPLSPSPLSDVFTIETDGGLAFTEGILDAKEGMPGQWFLAVSQTGETATILEVSFDSPEMAETPQEEEDDSLP